MENRDVSIRLNVETGGEGPRRLNDISAAIRSAVQGERDLQNHVRQTNQELDRRHLGGSRGGSASATGTAASLAATTLPIGIDGPTMLRQVLGPQLGGMISGVVMTTVQAFMRTQAANQAGGGVIGGNNQAQLHFFRAIDRQISILYKMSASLDALLVLNRGGATHPAVQTAAGGGSIPAAISNLIKGPAAVPQAAPTSVVSAIAAAQAAAAHGSTLPASIASRGALPPIGSGSIPVAAALSQPAAASGSSSFASALIKNLASSGSGLSANLPPPPLSSAVAGMSEPADAATTMAASGGVSRWRRFLARGRRFGRGFMSGEWARIPAVDNFFGGLMGPQTSAEDILAPIPGAIGRSAMSAAENIGGAWGNMTDLLSPIPSGIGRSGREAAGRLGGILGRVFSEEDLAGNSMASIEARKRKNRLAQSWIDPLDIMPGRDHVHEEAEGGFGNVLGVALSRIRRLWRSSTDGSDFAGNSGRARYMADGGPVYMAGGGFLGRAFRSLAAPFAKVGGGILDAAYAIRGIPKASIAEAVTKLSRATGVDWSKLGMPQASWFGDEAYGDFLPDEGTIRLNRRYARRYAKDPDHLRSTIAHEYAHKADWLHGMGSWFASEIGIEKKDFSKVRFSEFDHVANQGLQNAKYLKYRLQAPELFAHGLQAHMMGQRNVPGANEVLEMMSKQYPMYKAGGGMIDALLGSIFRPRGRDTVPAMLEPGEYVMPRRQTEQFRPILDMMRGHGATHMADGGTVYMAGGGQVPPAIGLLQRIADRMDMIAGQPGAGGAGGDGGAAAGGRWRGVMMDALNLRLGSALSGAFGPGMGMGLGIAGAGIAGLTVAGNYAANTMNIAQRGDMTTGERGRAIAEGIPVIGSVISSFNRFNDALQGITESIRRTRENLDLMTSSIQTQHSLRMQSTQFEIRASEARSSAAATAATPLEAYRSMGAGGTYAETIAQQEEDIRARGRDAATRAERARLTAAANLTAARNRMVRTDRQLGLARVAASGRLQADGIHPLQADHYTGENISPADAVGFRALMRGGQQQMENLSVNGRPLDYTEMQMAAWAGQMGQSASSVSGGQISGGANRAERADAAANVSLSLQNLANATQQHTESLRNVQQGEIELRRAESEARKASIQQMRDELEIMRNRASRMSETQRGLGSMNRAQLAQAASSLRFINAHGLDAATPEMIAMASQLDRQRVGYMQEQRGRQLAETYAAEFGGVQGSGFRDFVSGPNLEETRRRAQMLNAEIKLQVNLDENTLAQKIADVLERSLGKIIANVQLEAAARSFSQIAGQSSLQIANN